MSKETMKRQRRNRPAWPTYIAMLVLAVAFAGLAVRLHSIGVVPGSWLAVAAVNVILLELLLYLLKRKKGLRTVLAILALVLGAGCICVIPLANRINRALEEVTAEPQEQVSEVVILSLADGNIKMISDLAGKTIGYPENMPESSRAGVTGVLDAGGLRVNYKPYAGAAQAAGDLLEGKVDAILLYSAYVDLLEEEMYEDFSAKVQVVEAVSVSEPQESTFLRPRNDLSDSGQGDSGKGADTLAAGIRMPETFLVYISGIDTFGEISTRSRSDVNILAAVNTKTHEIQLVNTPRDYYVELPISNGMKDKLTHAGLYGIDVSAGALEQLYDVDIDQYVRVNFSGFEQLIDALGGIDVYSDYDFTVEPIKHYTVGMNHLSGIEALAFARERYSFAEGDVQRGRNQMAVISAVIDKATSPAVLSNFDEVLSSVSGCVQTSLSTKEIYALVRDQLSSGEGWHIESETVSGTGANEATYSIPGAAAYVMVPDEEQVEEAGKKLKAVLQKNQA